MRRVIPVRYSDGIVCVRSLRTSMSTPARPSCETLKNILYVFATVH